MSFPLARLHSLSVESFEAETSCLESELKLSLYTAPTCPLSEVMNRPVRPSHSLTELSKPAEAIHFPSGEKAT